jgi:hypothetical protein
MLSTKVVVVAFSATLLQQPKRDGRHGQWLLLAWIDPNPGMLVDPSRAPWVAGKRQLTLQ